MGMFYILTAALLTQMYIFANIRWTGYLKWMQFIAYKLHFKQIF